MGQMYSESEYLKEQLRRTQTETKHIEQAQSFYVSPHKRVEWVRENPSKNTDLSLHYFISDVK